MYGLERDKLPRDNFLGAIVENVKFRGNSIFSKLAKSQVRFYDIF